MNYYSAIRLQLEKKDEKKMISRNKSCASYYNGKQHKEQKQILKGIATKCERSNNKCEEEQ